MLLLPQRPYVPHQSTLRQLLHFPLASVCGICILSFFWLCFSLWDRFTNANGCVISQARLALQVDDDARIVDCLKRANLDLVAVRLSSSFVFAFVWKRKRVCFLMKCTALCERFGHDAAMGRCAEVTITMSNKENVLLNNTNSELDFAWQTVPASYNASALRVYFTMNRCSQFSTK
jgi:hypothetical protein